MDYPELYYLCIKNFAGLLSANSTSHRLVNYS